MTPYQDQSFAAVMPSSQPYQQYAQQNTLPNNQYQVQNFDTSGYPQTGLLGSEQALQGGLAGALTGLQYGTEQAQNALNQGFGYAQNYGNQAVNLLLGGQNPIPQGGYSGASFSGVPSSSSGAANIINGGQQQISGMFDEGVSALNQFLPQGQRAFDLQAGFTGANGADAQNAAYQGYMESPDVKFLREQGERSVMQNARAAGGVGGNVLKELQRYGTGVASQGFNDYYNRLTGVANTGMQAAQGVGALRGQQAGVTQGLIGDQLNADIASQRINADMSMQQNSLNAQAGMQGNQLAYDARARAADMLGNLGTAGYGYGSNVANLLGGAGNRAADYAYNTGNALSSGRTNAGNQIAALQGQEGVDISNMLGSSASNIAQLLAGTGDSVNSQQANLAALLANISTGTGSSAGNQTSVAQFQQTPNYLNQLGQITGAASAAQDAYDRYRQQQQNNNYYDYNMNSGGVPRA